MVKGSTRQVILVKSPDPKLFEEAIFIVREEALKGEGVTPEVAIAQARQAADRYLKQGRQEGKIAHLSPALWVSLGGVIASVCWGVGVFLG